MRKVSGIASVPYLKRPEFYVSVDELEKRGLSPLKTQDLAKEGVLKGVYVNNVLMLLRSGVDAWLREQEDPTLRRKRGRPPKGEVRAARPEEAPKRKRGRPPKGQTTPSRSKPLRKPGRPSGRVVESSGGEEAKRRPGRPRRAEETLERQDPLASALSGLLAGLRETAVLVRELAEARGEAGSRVGHFESSIELVAGLLGEVGLERAKKRPLVVRPLGGNLGGESP
jgi:hypothetical protein